MSSRRISSALSPFSRFDIPTWLEGLARRRGDHPLLIWAPPEGPRATWGYRRFVDDVARVAGGLVARGVKPGDRVLVHLENCPETLIARFACAWAGAVCVGTNAMAAGPEIGYFAEASGAVGAITQPKFAEIVAKHCSGIKWLAVTEDDAGTPAPAGSRPERSMAFSALMAEPLPRREPEPDAQASIMFTTGTTSRPKGVVWTHANVLWGGRVNALQQGMQPDDITLIFLPLYHVVGLSWCFLSTIWAGGTVVLQPRFSASRYWPLALETRATVSSQVFFTLNALANAGIPKHHFRRWIMPRFDPNVMEQFGVPFIAGWGMTEVLTQAIVCDPHMNPPARAIGRASTGYSVRIVDEDNRDVEPGGAGHLLLGGIRGLSIFAEYDGDAAATADAFDADGYFRTGDRVFLRENGWIEFSDRIKDVIKVGGEGVSASEIEAVVGAVPGVKDVAVVAKPHPDYGEVPVAFAVLVPNSGASEAQIRETIVSRCQEQLAKFKVPREVIFIPELPRVGFGKVSKAKLRERIIGAS